MIFEPKTRRIGRLAQRGRHNRRMKKLFPQSEFVAMCWINERKAAFTRRDYV